MTRRHRVPLVVLLGLVAASCSGSTDDTSPSSASSTTRAADAEVAPTSLPPETSQSPTTDVTTPSNPSDQPPPSEPGTTVASPSGAVPLAGSVQSVVAELPEAANFAAVVDGWLAAVPGQEGVLRNDRGVTLFVPVDGGFTVEERDGFLADPDSVAILLGEHLHVGVLEELEGVVVTAAGVEHVVEADGDDTVIGGRRVLRSVTATNGVVYLIAAPLPAAA